MLRVIILLLFTLPSLCIAEFNKNTITYLFADNCNIRTSPGITNSKVIDKLPFGYMVKILKKDNAIAVLNGIEDNWYFVEYLTNNQKKKGYTWGALLAYSYLKLNNKLIAIGYVSNSSASGLIGECRIIENNKLLSSLNFKTIHDVSDNNTYKLNYDVTSSIQNGMGMPYFNNIIKINYNRDACMSPSGNIWIGIKQDKLYYIIKDECISDGDVFNYTETTIFPSEKYGIKNKIIQIKLKSVYNEDIEDYNIIMNKTNKFTWDDNQNIIVKE